MKNVLIIVNPTSGEKKGAEYGERLFRIINKKGTDAHLHDLSKEQGFDDISELIKREKFDTAAVLGGDGTISSLVNEIAELKDRPDILLLPLGTTNNLARALNTELDLDSLLDKIEKEQLTPKKSDIGKVNDRYFVSTISAGSLPEVAWKTDESLKEKFGPFAYVLEGLKVLNKDQTFNIKITIDRKEIEHEDMQLIVIGLTNSIFGIPTFFEEGAVDDGRLYLFGLKKSDLIDEASTVANFVLWNDENNEGDNISFTSEFDQAKIEADTDIYLTIDGEKGPHFPIEVKNLHKHLTFLVPEKD